MLCAIALRPLSLCSVFACGRGAQLVGVCGQVSVITRFSLRRSFCRLTRNVATCSCTTAYPGRADFTGAQPTIARVVHSVCSSLTALVFSGRRQPHADDDAGAPPFGFRRGWAYTDCADERSSAGALHWHRERLLLHSPTEDTAVMDLDRGRRPIPVQQFLADGDR